MHEDLQNLISQLKNKTCPPEVMERVARQIEREKAAERSSNRWAAWAVAAALLLAVVAGIQGRRHLQERAAEQAAADQLRAERVRVARQAGGALALIGHRLLETAAHAESTLLKEAVPPLRQGFETAKNKVSQQI